MYSQPPLLCLPETNNIEGLITMHLEKYRYQHECYALRWSSMIIEGKSLWGLRLEYIFWSFSVSIRLPNQPIKDNPAANKPAKPCLLHFPFTSVEPLHEPFTRTTDCDLQPVSTAFPLCTAGAQCPHRAASTFSRYWISPVKPSRLSLSPSPPAYS